MGILYLQYRGWESEELFYPKTRFLGNFLVGQCCWEPLSSSSVDGQVGGGDCDGGGGGGKVFLAKTLRWC